MLHFNVTQAEIAEALGVSREAISKWVALFLAKGANGLRPRKSPGRKSKLSKQQKQLLKQQIQLGPKQHGYPGGVWTSAMIQEHIQKQFRVFYAVGYIPQLLHNMGLRHIKPKFTYSLTRDQLKEQIKWVRKRLPDLYQKVKEADGVLLFQDESSFQLQPNVMATWALKGNPPTEEKHSKRENLKVFGAIELFSGKLLYSIHDKKDKKTKKKERVTNKVFVRFLKQVGTHYKGRKVFMVIDGASYHSGAAVSKYLEKNTDMELIRQPVKSPNLNPIEKVWKELKKDRTHNVYFKDLGALKRALRKGLHHLQQHPESVKSLMKKWEKVVSEPELALSGKLDSSLIPKRHQNEIEEIRQEVSRELSNIL
jgi:transposase